MSYAKPKAMVIEQTYQSDFMRCFNISLHVICNMHMDYQLQAVSMKKSFGLDIDRNLDTNWYNEIEKP